MVLVSADMRQRKLAVPRVERPLKAAHDRGDGFVGIKHLCVAFVDVPPLNGGLRVLLQLFAASGARYPPRMAKRRQEAQACFGAP